MRKKDYTNNFDALQHTESKFFKDINDIDFKEMESKFVEGCRNEMEDIIGEICTLLREMEIYMENYSESYEVKDYYDTIVKGCEVLSGMS